MGLTWNLCCSNSSHVTFIPSTVYATASSHKHINTHSQEKEPTGLNELDCKSVLWAQSTTKDYIRAEHKLHSITKLFNSQVIIPQVRLNDTDTVTVTARKNQDESN